MTNPRHPTVEETIELIKNAHHGVFDDGGVPYWEHPVRVMNRIKNPTLVQKIIALLHDTIEDTHVTAKFLYDLGYSEEIVIPVQILSKNIKHIINKAGEVIILVPDGLTYMERIDFIISTGYIDAMLVKYHDNGDNSDPVRIAQLPEEKRSIVNRYERSMKKLKVPLTDLL